MLTRIYHLATRRNVRISGTASRDSRTTRQSPLLEKEAHVNGRLRCKLRFHKWIIKQDAPEVHRYWGCRYCDATQDIEDRPTHMIFSA